MYRSSYSLLLPQSISFFSQIKTASTIHIYLPTDYRSCLLTVLSFSGGRKSKKYPDGVKIDASEFPKDWFEGLRDEQVIVAAVHVVCSLQTVPSRTLSLLELLRTHLYVPDFDFFAAVQGNQARQPIPNGQDQGHLQTTCFLTAIS